MISPDPDSFPFGTPDREIPPRRIGSFFVSYAMFSEPESWRDLIPILSGIVPVRTEVHGDKNATLFIAFGDCFDEVPFGEVAPLYVIRPEIHHEGHETEYTTYNFHRVPDVISHPISDAAQP